MLDDRGKDYINRLLDTNGDCLEEADQDLFARLRTAKGEGDEAAIGADRLRTEAGRLDAVVINRQGRFDAISELLVESQPKDAQPPADDTPEKDPEPDCIPAPLDEPMPDKDDES